MDKPILTYEGQVTLLKQLFKKGQALDLVPLPGQEDASPCEEAAEEAFQSIGLDELYEKAKFFGIQEKYPRFYDYLEQLQKNREKNIRNTEKLPENASIPEEEGMEAPLFQTASMQNRMYSQQYQQDVSLLVQLNTQLVLQC